MGTREVVPWLQKSPLYASPFRANIKDFVRRHARRIVLPEWQRAAVYLVDLFLPGGTIKLHVYEEKTHVSAVCDQCRCMGAYMEPQGHLQVDIYSMNALPGCFGCNERCLALHTNVSVLLISFCSYTACLPSALHVTGRMAAPPCFTQPLALRGAVCSHAGGSHHTGRGGRGF